MKFTTILGKLNDEQMKEVRKAEDKLSTVFTDLSLNYTNQAAGTKIGGDPLVFQLVYPLPHVCDAVELMIDGMRDEDIIKNMRDMAPGEEAALPEDIKKYKAQLKGKVLRTAATDGKRFYWNPKFVNEKSRLGLRIVVAHEAWHAIFTHPSRRSNRLPGLWNIAVDFKVNFTIMEDLKARNIKDYPKVFETELGQYITFGEYSSFLKDPFNPPPRLAHFNPMEDMKAMVNPGYVHPGKDKPPMYYADSELTQDFKRPENIYEHLLKQIPKCPECGKLGFYKKPEEYKKLEKQAQEKAAKEAQAKQAKDKNDKTNSNNPTQAAPPAPHERPGNQSGNQPGGNKGQSPGGTQPGNQPGNAPGQHSHGNGSPCEHNHGDHGHGNEPGDQAGNQPGGNQPGAQAGENNPTEGNAQGGQPGQNPGQATPGNFPGAASEEEKCCDESCGTCADPNGDYMHVPFDRGETLDDHIDSDISEEALAKRIHEAITAASKMAGKIPGGLEDELGILSAPKLTWQDFIRNKITRKRDGFGTNDWSRARTRPLFAGIYSPRRRDYFVKMLFAYDTSGSMGKDDIAFGISQVQVLADKAKCWAVSWDTQPYWESMVVLDKVDLDELKKVKIVGRGGTEVSAVFNEYADHIEDELDMIIIATDGYLYDQELSKISGKMKDIDVIWLITSNNTEFKPPIGRVFHLHNM